MNRVDEIVVIKFGRAFTQRLDIKAWRKRMRRYRTLKAQVLKILAATGWSAEETRQWLDTQVPALRNRTPRHMIHPKRIGKFYEWLKVKNRLPTQRII